MPLITSSNDSLPYIDLSPSPAALAHAQDLITASLAPTSISTPHPLLPPAPEPRFTALATLEQSRLAAGESLAAIDLSRYEAEPSTDSDPQAMLKGAYTNAAYIRDRLTQLNLLDTFGKNAWLVGNSQLESILHDIEKELVHTRERTEETNRERRRLQESGREEMEGAERGWRGGVGRVLETGVGLGGADERIKEELRGGGR